MTRVVSTGSVQLECRKGALYAIGNSCSLRPGTPEAAVNARGYFKILRGQNYHGIETGCIGFVFCCSPSLFESELGVATSWAQ